MVDSVDLTSHPPLLSIGGQNYTIDQIKRVIRPVAAAACAPAGVRRILPAIDIAATRRLPDAGPQRERPFQGDFVLEP